MRNQSGDVAIHNLQSLTPPSARELLHGQTKAETDPKKVAKALVAKAFEEVVKGRLKIKTDRNA